MAAEDLDVEPKRKKQKLQSNNTIGYRGVYKSRTKFMAAKVQFDGKPSYIGTFDTAIQAALAYDQAAIKAGCKSHTLNFPERVAAEDPIPWSNRTDAMTASERMLSLQRVGIINELRQPNANTSSSISSISSSSSSSSSSNNNNNSNNKIQKIVEIEDKNDNFPKDQHINNVEDYFAFGGMDALPFGKLNEFFTTLPLGSKTASISHLLYENGVEDLDMLSQVDDKFLEILGVKLLQRIIIMKGISRLDNNEGTIIETIQEATPEDDSDSEEELLL